MNETSTDDFTMEQLEKVEDRLLAVLQVEELDFLHAAARKELERIRI